jgi:cellulose synthase/poly-beta-1,6-N-acetylglucosamine synthase-like glycosyltransferase
LIGLTLLLSFFFCILGIHAAYPLLLRRLGRRKTASVSPERAPALPFVSIIIPVYNEELVIERRLNNIFETTYPKDNMEVIVVDDGSTDKTSAIVREKYHNEVKLLQESRRRGKAHAINVALEKSRGEIFILTDGPALFHNGTISSLVECFRDSSLGGISSLWELPNSNDSSVTVYEKSFSSYKDNISLLESALHSTSWIFGAACAFRKGSVSQIPQDTIADDSNIALQLITKHYRVIMDEKSHFVKKSPSHFGEYCKIKTRRALGVLIETLRFRFLLFNPQYGNFGLIIFPYRFFIQLVGPMLFLGILSLVPLAAIEIGVHFGLQVLLFTVGIALVASYVFRAKVIPYILSQLIGIAAIIFFLSRKVDVLWVQSRSIRT